MFGISGFELLLIAAFALVIFGPDKLPQFGRTAGRFLRDFKRTQEEMEAMMRAEMYGEKKKKKSAVSSEGDSDVLDDMASMESEPVSRAEEWADDDDEEEEEE